MIGTTDCKYSFLCACPYYLICFAQRTDDRVVYLLCFILWEYFLYQLIIPPLRRVINQSTRFVIFSQYLYWRLNFTCTSGINPFVPPDFHRLTVPSPPPSISFRLVLNVLLPINSSTHKMDFSLAEM
jgi:hypothetical protein